MKQRRIIAFPTCLLHYNEIITVSLYTFNEHVIRNVVGIKTASTVNPYRYLLALRVQRSNFALVAGTQTAQKYRLDICCSCCFYEVDNHGLFFKFL
jgi:hypothetical protein